MSRDDRQARGARAKILGASLAGTVLLIAVLWYVWDPVGYRHRDHVTAEVRRAKADERAFELALGIYEAHNGSLPTTQQGLRALLSKPAQAPIPSNWSGPYLKGPELLRDPWGEPYHYRTLRPGDFVITSYGADRRPGGTGSGEDIVSDDPRP